MTVMGDDFQSVRGNNNSIMLNVLYLASDGSLFILLHFILFIFIFRNNEQ